MAQWLKGVQRSNTNLLPILRSRSDPIAAFLFLLCLGELRIIDYTFSIIETIEANI